MCSAPHCLDSFQRKIFEFMDRFTHIKPKNSYTVIKARMPIPPVVKLARKTMPKSRRFQAIDNLVANGGLSARSGRRLKRLYKRHYKVMSFADVVKYLI